ncbi:MAG: HAMP domain-containing histidine kinase [Pyrinomonadaceae bacterium]|nr:HAMP domain-containing histidine kinase [Pyrinomonadaceae bacterium]
MLVFGIIFFAAIITGLVLNTTFLVREIRRNEQQNAFLNAMTHELKTPIASIKLYLETVKTRDLPEEKRREFYDVMLSDSDRLLNTVEQVLQASRTREKKRELNYSDVKIAELIAESVRVVRSRYNLVKEEIVVGDFDNDITVEGDLSELKTAFGNLLDNAVKYSNDEINISVRGRVRTGGWIDIYVKDNGYGIPASEVRRVFRRFYRVPNESADNTKGTGLGLYIVESIIKKHGGKVFAKSRGIGFGSTFTVRLPIKKKADSPE